MNSRKVFEAEEQFHKNMAKLTFEEKIRILKRLQKVAQSMKKARKISQERVLS